MLPSKNVIEYFAQKSPQYAALQGGYLAHSTYKKTTSCRWVLGPRSSVNKVVEVQNLDESQFRTPSNNVPGAAATCHSACSLSYFQQVLKIHLKRLDDANMMLWLARTKKTWNSAHMKRQSSHISWYSVVTVVVDLCSALVIVKTSDVAKEYLKLRFERPEHCHLRMHRKSLRNLWKTKMSLFII